MNLHRLVLLVSSWYRLLLKLINRKRLKWVINNELLQNDLPMISSSCGYGTVKIVIYQVWRGIAYTPSKVADQERVTLLKLSWSFTWKITHFVSQHDIGCKIITSIPRWRIVCLCGCWNIDNELLWSKIIHKSIKSYLLWA